MCWFQKLAHIWEGVVELKNSQARMSLRFIRGNMNLAMRALDSTLLNINQRMTLEETELEGLSHNLQVSYATTVIPFLFCGKLKSQFKQLVSRFQTFKPHLFSLKKVRYIPIS